MRYGRYPMAASGGFAVAFLPWVVLKCDHEVCGVRFVRFLDDEGVPHPTLTDVAVDLVKILSGYVDVEGDPVENCTVALTSPNGWNIDPEETFDNVTEAASLLFLAGFANNEYFPGNRGPYVNSIHFRVIGQRFMPGSGWVTLASKRRDGRNLDGGRQHGEVKSSQPLQCSRHQISEPDDQVLRALDLARSSKSETAQRLKTALPFVELANTDDDLMNWHAEAVLMACAFEQMLEADGSKRDLVVNFAPFFNSFGSVTVQQALAERPDVFLDPEYESAQRDWWIHKKWIEELYQVRNKVAHRGSIAGRAWAWNSFEHLVMAAFVFPLMLKAMLQAEGHYAMTARDRGSCRAIDKLLASVDWGDRSSHQGMTARWRRIVDTAREGAMWDELAEQTLASLPADPAEPAKG